MHADLTPKEFANRFGARYRIGVRKVRDLCRRGVIGYKVAGGQWRVPADDEAKLRVDRT